MTSKRLSPLAAEPRLLRRLPDRALTALVVALLVVLLAVGVGGWLAVRSPGLDPVDVPAVDTA